MSSATNAVNTTENISTKAVTVKVKEVKSAIAFLAAGFGLLMVSLLNLAQSFTGGLNGPVGKFLMIHSGIGPYSGKQAYSVLVWVIAWAILGKLLPNKNLEPAKIMRWAYILIGVAGLLVFPPLVELIVP